MFKINNKFKVIFTFFCLSLTPGVSLFFMQAINYYHTSMAEASNLTFYGSIPGLIASFVMFSLVLKAGFRRAIMVNYGILAIYYFIAPFVSSVDLFKVQLLLTSISFVAVKLVMYTSVSLLTDNENSHARMINFMEGCFSTGGIISTWVIAYFIEHFPNQWYYVFWVYCGLSLVLFLLWALSPFDESALKTEEDLPLLEQLKGFKGILTPGLIVFLIMLLAQDWTEQGIGQWTPFFNNSVLQLPAAVALQVASLGSIASALGRFWGAFLLKFVRWHKMLIINLVLTIIFLLFVFANLKEGAGMNASSIFHAPLIVFALPAIGIFTSPLYPTLASLLMTTMPKSKHALVTTLLIIVGYTFDTIVIKATGELFDKLGGIAAFKIGLIIPFLVILALVYPYYLLHRKAAKDNFNEE